VPAEAVAIVAGILAATPEQFPQFDPVEAQDAIDYEKAIAPVAQAALVLAKRLAKSVLKRRTRSAQNTLAVYLVMKGMSRLDANETTRTQVRQLKALFSTTTRSKATSVSQKEADAMVKERTAQKKAEVATANLATAASDAALATAHVTLQEQAKAGALPVPPLPGGAPQSTTTLPLNIPIPH
jgi:hypothetical protein